MMAGLKLTRFHTTKTFLDLASVRAADGAYLVTIEHLYQEPKSWHDALTERTAWRFWRCAEPGNMLRQSSESTVTAPSAISASASISKNKLSALIESNQEHAAFLLTWNLVPSQPVQVPESSPALLSFDLDATRANQVQVDRSEAWSTIGLQPRRWLFNPSVASFADRAEVVVAMNTADAHAIVWKSNGTTQPTQPLAFLSDALEPVATVEDSTMLLFYRQPTPKWSIYFHSSKYSGTSGPLALPLLLGELDETGHMLRSVNLSKERGVGDVFAFSVSGDSKGRLVLAVISGTKDKPELRLYLSSDREKTLQELGATSLSAVPDRLTVAATEVTAVVGLVYKETGGYQVEGVCVSLGR